MALQKKTSLYKLEQVQTSLDMFRQLFAKDLEMVALMIYDPEKKVCTNYWQPDDEIKTTLPPVSLSSYI